MHGIGIQCLYEAALPVDLGACQWQQVYHLVVLTSRSSSSRERAGHEYGSRSQILCSLEHGPCSLGESEQSHSIQ